MFRRHLSSIALAVAATLGSLVLVEIVVRVAEIGPEIHPVHSGMYRLSDNPVLGYEFVPGGTDGKHRVNSLGFRGPERPMQKPEDTFRIVCLGDSVTFGFWVDASQTWYARLEEALTRDTGESGLRFEVLNLGVIGYNVFQVVERFRQFGRALEPDLVLFAYCLNDPQSYSLEMERLRANMTEAEESYWSAAVGHTRSLLARSRTFLLARYAIQRRMTPQEPTRHFPELTDDPQFAELRSGRYVDYFSHLHEAPSIWDPAREALEELRNLSNAEGVPLHVVLFPLLRDLADHPLEPVHEKLGKAFSELGFTHQDLQPALAAIERELGRPVAVDAFHPTAEGHRMAAIQVLRELVSEGLLPGVDAADLETMLASDERDRRFGRLVAGLGS